MAVTADTRTQLIGLSVAMLGSAPGTDRLNDWVDDLDDDMSVEDLANHIEDSDDFQDEYPAFMTDGEFAEAFMGNLLGDYTTAEVSAMVVEAVEGLLGAGHSRGEVALVVVTAMLAIAAEGESHDLYEALGMASVAFHNKVMVAEHYTVMARMEDPSASVLEGVTADADSVMMAKDAIDNPPPTPEEMEGQTFTLGTLRDKVTGTAYDDTIISEPDSKGDATLGPADTIDGGDGYDSLEIFNIETDGIMIDSAVDADVMNVEHVYLSARNAIHVDLSEWEGLEMVEIGRFGRDEDVMVTVDGASVSSSRTIDGDVTIAGAAGEVSVAAGKTSVVRVESGAHTTSVMAKGGMTVDVASNGANGQSMTVTSVSIDGVAGEDLGADGRRGNPMEPVENPLYDPSATGGGADTFRYLTDAGVMARDNNTSGNLADNIDDVDGDDAEVTNTAADAAMILSVFKDGKKVDQGTAGAEDGTDSGDVPVHIYSDAIESIELHNTWATVAVVNKSKTPQDLAVTVNKYGTDKIGGKLCLAQTGAAANVDLTVVGDSNFILAGNATKTIDVTLDADLKLGVTKFQNPNPDMPSDTLESVMLSGGGDFEMNAMGLSKLKTIDASGASGDVIVTNLGGSATSYMGGSGFDCLGVAAHNAKGIMVNLGMGDDVFKSGASSNKSRVDGGDGMDTLHLTSSAGISYDPDGPTGPAKPVSIYSNFETLNVGGSGEATYDVKLLGVGNVVVADASATGPVTLSNMADGMGISVHGKGAGISANIVHAMADREPGAARYSGELNVNLLANGGATDTKAITSGEAMLTLSVDEEIEILSIDSSANAGGSSPTVSARNKPGAGHYENTVTLNGTNDASAATVEAIVVSGNAKVVVMQSTVSGSELGFGQLELVDAEDNTGGVTVDATGTAEEVDMVGGSAKDVFTGGAQGDDIRGNGGNDMLTGGAGDDSLRGGAGGDMLIGDTADDSSGNDTYDYTSASDSQVAWTATGTMYGFDTIVGFNGARTLNNDGTVATAGDVISLGRTLFNSLKGSIKAYTGDDAISSTDTADPDPPAGSLQAFLGDGDGIFETVTRNTDGFGSTTAKHSIATVTETYDGDPATDGVQEANRLWVLIDVDGDGDFDAGTDMAIVISGLTGELEFADFSA